MSLRQVRFRLQGLLRGLIPLLLLVFPVGWGIPNDSPEPTYHLKVLAMDVTGVELEFELDDFDLYPQRMQESLYYELAVPGMVSMSALDQPQLPALGRLLGIPAAGVDRVDILDSVCETRHEVQLLPTAHESESSQDSTEQLDRQDAYYPGRLADIGFTGRLREQLVAQVRIFPFQYNAARHWLRVCRRLHIRVRFGESQDSAHIPGSTTQEIGALGFEPILQSVLLNFGALAQIKRPAPDSQQEYFADNTVSHITPPLPMLKIFVQENAVYKVTYDDLKAAGFDIDNVTPRYLHMKNGGHSIPMHVIGEEDGSFDPGDWLLFYGQSADTPFTDRNVYWLSVDDHPSARMSERDTSPTDLGTMPTAFRTTLEFEENHEYWSMMPNGAGQDHWFWSRFPSAPSAETYYFALGNLAPIIDEAVIQVRLHGRTSTSVDPDHHTRILLNNSLIDEAWWDGQVPFTHTMTVSQQILNTGTNTLKIVAVGDTGADVDSLYVDRFAIKYWATYVAQNDELFFSPSDTMTVTFSLHGFDQPGIQLYDISDPLRVTRLMNSRVEADGPSYRLRYTDYVAPGAQYVALTNTQMQAPDGLLLDEASNWRSPANGADYIIITHPEFTETAADLATLRADQGLRVITAQITDIYDEFSFGVFDPRAIRDFLSYAYHGWVPPAPLFVLLMGDANYDYHDYLETGNPNYVPTHLFESPIIGQTPTDNWFVSVSGDDPLPDMVIGRLPVRSAFSAQNALDKIKVYESSAYPAQWQQRALFVADDNPSFEIGSDELIAMLPSNYNAQRIYPSLFPAGYDPTSDILRAIDDGTLLVNYLGHGSILTWSAWNGQLTLGSTDLAALNNAPFYPFLVTGNCLNGLFAHPITQDSLAERFVTINGKGGVGAWSPTGLGYTYWHDQLVRALYAALFEDSIYQLGLATTAAKIEGYAEIGWTEPIEIFTLLGDPALALKVAQPRLGLAKSATTSSVQSGGSLSYILTYSNGGSIPAENVILSDQYDPHTLFTEADPPPTSGNNTWELGTLLPGAAGSIVITVQVAEHVPYGTVLLNQASLSGHGLDTITSIAYTPIRYNRFFLPIVLDR